MLEIMIHMTLRSIMKPHMLFPPPILLTLGLILFTLSCSDDNPANPDGDNNKSNTVTDIDGNVYPTTTIGTQIWASR